MNSQTLRFPSSADELATIPSSHWEALLAGAPSELSPWLAVAASLGDSNAQAMLAQMLLDGNGVAQDAPRAFAMFCAAADQGQAMAMNMRARCLEHGWGVMPDLSAAAEWYRHAALSGLDWGMYNFANLLSCGRGLPLDQKEALTWYEKAAALGHAKSLNLVGRYYEDGIVVGADRNIAFKYYRASAIAGDFRGQYSYACMLAERGRIVAAEQWLRKIPATATVPFLRKIGCDLLLSAHPSFRIFAEELLARSEEWNER